MSFLPYEDRKEDRVWGTLEAIKSLRASVTTVVRPVRAFYLLRLWGWLENDPYEITAPEDSEAPP